MRMSEMTIDSNGFLKLDVNEYNGCVVVIDQGKAKVAKLQQHGETRVITHQGKVKRVRFEEGEDF